MIDNIVESNQLSDLQVDSSLTPNLQRQNRLLKMIIAVISLLFISTLTTLVLLVFLTKKDNSNTQLPTAQLTQATPQPTMQAKVNTTVPNDWKIYKNVKYGFSFNYPSDWAITSAKTHLNGLLSEANIKKHTEYFEISPIKEVNSGGNYKENPNTLSIEINTVFNNDTVNDEKFICNGEIDGLDCLRFLSSGLENFFNIGDIKFAEYSRGVDDWFNQFHIRRYFKIGNSPNTITANLYMNGGDYKDNKLFFDQILSTFRFTDATQTNSIEDDVLNAANMYLGAYTTADWETAKRLCGDESFNSEIAQDYGFVSYQITGSKTDSDPDKYHVYIRFTQKDGTIDKAPHSTNKPLEVLMSRDETGQWKALTWYFYQ